MPSARKTPRLALLILLAALLAPVPFLAVGASAAKAASWRKAPPAELPHKSLFDAGVTDYDGDGFLDLFTINHKERAVLLHNRGGDGFANAYAPAGLSPSPAFPGLEYLREPPMEEPAVYVYLTDSQRSSPGVLHLRSLGRAAAGRVTFETKRISIIRSRDVAVERGETAAGRPVVSFRLRPGSVLDIRATHIDMPIALSFATASPGQQAGSNEGLRPGDIRVGSLAVPATSGDFLLTLRDRHAFAFAELGGGAGMDLFAASGGLGGGIKLPRYRGLIEDELLIDRGGGLHDESVGSGLGKGACRGRQAAAVDVDADGLLDLFETCKGKPPKVYMQRRPGSFREVGSPRSTADAYRWVDLGGRRPSLLAAEEDGIRVIRRAPSGWRSVQLIRGASEGRVAHFALGDLGSDGDLDVLATTPKGSTMLRNRRGRLREVPMRELGLPAASLAASFVDYDNDGRQDVHLVPQGLYHGTPSGRFRPTGELRAGAGAGAAATTWFDAHNDGLREPLIIFGNMEFADRMSVVRRSNLGPGGHWLEVDLIGAAGNRQAIGGRVRIRAGGMRQYQWVGQNDDSRHSQGHYRLYFGLGSARRVGALTAYWPDGAKKRLRNVRADRVLRLAHP